MSKYYYCVNTFKGSEPVQLSGYIEARYETDYRDDGWYDYCYECSGYGNDYFLNDDGELECYCPDCLMNPFNS